MTGCPRFHLRKCLVPLILPLLILTAGGCHRKSPPGAKRFDALITSDGVRRSLRKVMKQDLSHVIPGSPDGARAANWFADTFSQFGLSAGGNRQTYFVEYPLPDINRHEFARNIVGHTTGMRTINGGILLTTVYTRLDSDESETDSDAVKASAARVALLLEIANATAGRPGDTPIYFSARSERPIPEAKDLSTVIDLKNSPGSFRDDTLWITADSIPDRWQPFLGNLSDSVMNVDFHYHGVTSASSPKVKINVYLPTNVWARATEKKQRQNGLEELAHSAQIIRKLLYRIAMLQPEIPAPADSSQIAPHPIQ